MKYLNLLFIFLIGCVSTDLSDVPKPTFRKPAESAKVYKPVGEWDIRSEKDLSKLEKIGVKVSKRDGIPVVDLNGNILDGSRQKGDGSQKEDQTPLFRARMPLILRNGFIKDNKNALVFYAPNSAVERITWLNIGEDAVATFDGAKNFSVINCEFQGAQDKNVQLNEASGARIFGNTIYGGITGVRLGEIDYTESDNRAYCGNNTFLGVDTAWNAAKLTLTVEEKNKYKSTRLPFKLTKGAKVKNPDGQIENE